MSSETRSFYLAPILALHYPYTPIPPPNAPKAPNSNSTNVPAWSLGLTHSVKTQALPQINKSQNEKKKNPRNLKCCWLVLNWINCRNQPFPLKQYIHFPNWNLNDNSLFSNFLDNSASWRQESTFSVVGEVKGDWREKIHAWQNWSSDYYSNFPTNLPSSIFLLFLFLLLWGWWARTARLPNKARER